MVRGSSWCPLAVALPDQDQAERGQRSAVPGPMDLIDDQARWRTGDRTGALTDPEQAHGERKKANGQKQFSHGSFLRSVGRAGVVQRCQSDALARAGQEWGRR